MFSVSVSLSNVGTTTTALHSRLIFCPAWLDFVLISEAHGWPSVCWSHHDDYRTWFLMFLAVWMKKKTKQKPLLYLVYEKFRLVSYMYNKSHLKSPYYKSFVYNRKGCSTGYTEVTTCIKQSWNHRENKNRNGFCNIFRQK